MDDLVSYIGTDDSCRLNGLRVTGIKMIRAPQGLSLFLCLLSLVACETPPESDADESGTAERIVSLSPHLTELVYAAGAGDSLVGTVEFSDFPPAALSLPRVGDAFRVDYEALARLQPDLVLAWGTGTPLETVAKLQALGYRVVSLEPESIEAIAAELEQIGKLAGSEAVARQSAQALLSRRDALRDKYAGRSELRVFLQIAAEPLISINGEHVISAIIDMCGGLNVFADAVAIAPAVSREAVLAAQPDVILAATSPAESGWEDEWRKWQQLPAVRLNQLYSVNRDLISRSGPRIVDGAEEVCVALDSARRDSE